MLDNTCNFLTYLYPLFYGIDTGPKNLSVQVGYNLGQPGEQILYTKDVTGQFNVDIEDSNSRACAYLKNPIIINDISWKPVSGLTPNADLVWGSSMIRGFLSAVPRMPLSGMQQGNIFVIPHLATQVPAYFSTCCQNNFVGNFPPYNQPVPRFYSSQYAFLRRIFLNESPPTLHKVITYDQNGNSLTQVTAPYTICPNVVSGIGFGNIPYVCSGVVAQYNYFQELPVNVACATIQAGIYTLDCLMPSPSCPGCYGFVPAGPSINNLYFGNVQLQVNCQGISFSPGGCGSFTG